MSKENNLAIETENSNPIKKVSFWISLEIQLKTIIKKESETDIRYTETKVDKKLTVLEE